MWPRCPYAVITWHCVLSCDGECAYKPHSMGGAQCSFAKQHGAVLSSLPGLRPLLRQRECLARSAPAVQSLAQREAGGGGGVLSVHRRCDTTSSDWRMLLTCFAQLCRPRVAHSSWLCCTKTALPCSLSPDSVAPALTIIMILSGARILYHRAQGYIRTADNQPEEEGCTPPHWTQISSVQQTFGFQTPSELLLSSDTSLGPGQRGSLGSQMHKALAEDHRGFSRCSAVGPSPSSRDVLGGSTTARGGGTPPSWTPLPPWAQIS